MVSRRLETILARLRGSLCYGVDGERTRGGTLGPTRRLTLREAAELLGISKEGVRKRAIRGSLPTDKDPDGRVYVYLDVEADNVADTSAGNTRDPRDQLIMQLQSEVEAWREESRRKDHIIAGLVERLPPQLEPPRGEGSSPLDEREYPTAATVETESSQPRSAGGGQQEPTEPRSWWRRVFGA
jgi:hypothetical protein